MDNLPPDSILIHLGDICMGGDKLAHEKFIKPLRCRKWLVRGNHDKKSATWYYQNGWDVVVDGLDLKLFGKKIHLSHRPIPIGDYDFNIHGHFHNSRHRVIEPGVETMLTPQHLLLAEEYVHYQPVSLEKFISEPSKNY